LDDHGDIVVSGTVENQVRFYPRFDHVVLLSAPLKVLMQRLRTRTNNPYGRSAEDAAEVAGYVETAEPLLRRGATVELDGQRPLAELCACRGAASLHALMHWSATWRDTDRGGPMKVGIVGVGAVGSAAATALLARGCAREIVLVDKNSARATGVALDMGYGLPLLPPVDLRAGDAGDLAAAELLIITAGVNEAAGGATDRSDPSGRLRLLDRNAAIYRELIPDLVAAAPRATIMVVTDPPDPLAELTRALAGHDRVFSTGTVLDGLRFRVHLSHVLEVRPHDVQAHVVGEHGTSQVLLWSSANVAGVPVLDILSRAGGQTDHVREEVESQIRYANINIIEGIGASQYGIGAVVGRLAEAVLRDEQALFTVAAHDPDRQVTLSLLSALGAEGASRTYLPAMTEEERQALERSAEILRQATASIM
jgi:L-lactate dehydrogenase